jgi:2-polyprenyl-6-methoxyphenol hydroxylase-like FAD-dependent oxidoreductase
MRSHRRCSVQLAEANFANSESVTFSPINSIDDCVKWWGPDRHIVMYYVNLRRDEVYFVTSTPEPEFKDESWSAKGDLSVLREAYAGFHPQVRAVLAACPEVHKWALVERDPLPRWSDGRTTLLGDACHPMTPYMAQGAAAAMEDRPFYPAVCPASMRTASSPRCAATS